ncbi:MAG: adenylate/guanylate cyclase domain-containing protein [Myxococcaceae bacterium]
MRKWLAVLRLRLKRNLPAMFVIAAIATAFSAVWWQFDVFDISSDELNAYDSGLQKFILATKFPWNLSPWSTPRRSKDITILAIDDDSVRLIRENQAWSSRYGNWPYDRTMWADLAPWLKSLEVKAFVGDITMDEPHNPPDGDNAFHESLEDTGLRAYLGFNVHPEALQPPKVDKPVNRLAPEAPPAPADAGEAGSDEFPEEPSPEEQAKQAEAARQQLVALAAKELSFPVRTEGEVTLAAIPDTEGKPSYPVPPIQPALEAVSGWGAVIQEGDDDGKLRSTKFAYTDGNNTYVTLPVAVAADLWNAKEIVISPGHLKIGDHDLKVNKDGSAGIDYGGTFTAKFATVKLARALQCYNAEKALAHLEEAKLTDKQLEATKALIPGCSTDEYELFRGKIVILAGLGTGMGDSKATPLESNVPGVVKQAATLQNILDEKFVIDAPFWISLLFAFLVAFFSSMLVLVVRNTAIDIIWPVLLLWSFFIVTGAFLLGTRFHVLSAMPGLCGTVASIMSTAWERLYAGKERERLKAMFQNYMEADLVEMIVEYKQLPRLDGTNQIVTAFFSDIRGFSTFAERFRDDPRGLMRVLNRYFSTVTPVITEFGACIDKYVGDSVVALFGAPAGHTDHAVRACKAALEVQAAIEKLRVQFKNEGLPDMYTRIGLNSGEMCVGNVGSDQLLDYTAIGDDMNLASRLEGVNKQYGTLILIGPKTYDYAREHIEVREVDQVRVAGKHEATVIYELLALKGQLSETKAKLIALYAQALSLYRQRDFQGARTLLDQALLLDGEDGPTQTLYQRCTTYLTAPPAPAWDGVTSLEK